MSIAIFTVLFRIAACTPLAIVTVFRAIGAATAVGAQFYAASFTAGITVGAVSISMALQAVAAVPAEGFTFTAIVTAGATTYALAAQTTARADSV